jgi:long-chain acyl-CoA synthetase
MIKPGLRAQRWSYDKLWLVSGQVASWLQEEGARQGDRVILWAPNLPEWVAAFFGCLRAGAIVVPLDVRSAPDFADRVVAQTEPRLAFLSRLTPQRMEKPDVRKVYLEDLQDIVSGKITPAQAVTVHEDDMAEIMFTSGTTGDPKGVILTHRNIVSNLEAASRYIPGKPSYRALSILPLSHVFEQCGGLFNTLKCGASIVYPVSRQPSVIFKTLRENQITTLLLVPQALQLFANAIEREAEKQNKFRQWRRLHSLAPRLPMGVRRLLFRAVHRRLGGHLEFIGSGGAYLDPQLARTWENMGIPVVQGYGTTETAPVISTNSLEERKPGSVGRVLEGQEVIITDDGEILTRGPNVFQGYWRAPQATEAAFEDGWYKTGDLGHLDDEGYLYLKGRKKDLIVLANGQNVYPEDIEGVLASHPAVTEAVVVGLPKGGGEVQVHAVLLMNDETQTSAAIREANGRLADHQQIQGSTLWPEEDFPRSHTQKAKKHLVLEFATKAAREKGPAPTTGPKVGDEVSNLQRIVAQVSSLPPAEIGGDKSLGDDLSIDSLGRVELLSAIEQELGIYVEDGQVGPRTTVAELERLLAEKETGPSPIRFYLWPLKWWSAVARTVILKLLVFPWLRTQFRIKVEGLQNLDAVEAPVIFAANHTVRWDSLLILKALPGKWRRRVAYAKVTETALSRQWIDVIASLVVNAFPLSSERVIRPSLEHMGKLLDGGWCVGIFPEGVQLIGEEIQPFKSGTGLVAVQCGTPAVPVRLTYIKRGLSWLAIALRREEVSIKFGRPLFFSNQTPYSEATAAIEEAVRAL